MTTVGQPFNQPSNAPSAKLSAATVGAGTATLLSILLKTFYNVDLGVEGAGALAVVLTFLFGYVIKERSVE